MILIVCAMESEARVIKESLVDAEIFRITPQKYYYKGFLDDKEVVVVVTGIGKVNAGATTSLILAKESFEYIVNIGFSGGVKPLKLGDIVVISDASYHDVDLTSINNIYEVGQLPDMPHPFLSDYELVKGLKRSLNADAVSLYTGDKFMTKKAFETLGVYDMEGAAIYQAAYVFNTPVVAVKLISDILDSKTQERDYIKFEQEADIILKNIVLKAISQ